MSYDERYRKWEGVAKRYKIDNTRLATFQLTVKNVLKLLKNKKEGLAIDIGCGFGSIDVLLAQNTDFKIIAMDISDTALEAAKKNVMHFSQEERIKVEKGDVYNLSYPDNYFDVIFSFGYVSAATYPSARNEVYRVLKPGGLLICDFINHVSLYKLPFLIKNIFLGYTQLGEFSKIKKDFKKTGFKFLSKIYFNTYPPIFKNIFPVWTYLLFEKTIGRPLKKILGRVILVSFKKI